MDQSRTSLQNARRIVVKVGSSLLTDGGKALDAPYVARLAAELHALRASGREVVLVTSGSVAAGVSALGMAKPREIRMKQAAAAVGQSRLMHTYEGVFAVLGVQVAQVLVTHDDLANRRRFLNARNALSALLELGVLPICNENDTVVVEEIRFGDNDNLSALVASLIGADLLILLSDVPGLYTADPRIHPDAERISSVVQIDNDLRQRAGSAGSDQGTGGMATKLEAAEKASAVGIPTVIAHGRDEGILRRIVDGEDVGTLFHAATDRLASRKHWIAFNLRPAGRLWIDDGAARALRGSGCSLLPSGITKVDGRFSRGDAVSICDGEGTEFARGLSDYTADETRRIAGKQSVDIEGELGYKYSDVVVHRDDLVVLATVSEQDTVAEYPVKSRSTVESDAPRGSPGTPDH